MLTQYIYIYLTILKGQYVQWKSMPNKILKLTNKKYSFMLGQFFLNLKLQLENEIKMGFYGWA